MSKIAFVACIGLGVALATASNHQALAANTAQLSNVTITTSAGHTLFQADISAAVPYSATTQANPNRVTIDLPNLEFDLPVGAGHDVAGAITSYRYGVADEKRSRIVLDTKMPVVIGASSIKPAKGKTPARLVIDLVETSQQGFADAPEKDETASIAPAPLVKTEATKHKKVVVIDPGHGGIDPGAIGHGRVKEKDVVFAFAIRLRDALEATGQFEVVMTRTDDTLIGLEHRVQIAREGKADLLIALHADTLRDGSVRGTTVYTVSEKASDSVAEALAQRENRADIIAGMDLGKQTPDVANVLINLAQRESKNQAMNFAKKAITEFKPITEVGSKPIRSAAFVVLKAPDVPSVLVELGYLSSRKDEAMLISKDWQGKMAAALTKAIERFFAPAPTTAAN